MNAAKFSCFAIVLAFAATQTQAQQATPWGSLPKATVGALRIQNTQKIVDSLRDKTKLGAMLFSKERIAIREMARVVKPGGVFIISGITKWSPYNAWNRLVYRRIRRRKVYI